MPVARAPSRGGGLKRGAFRKEVEVEDLHRGERAGGREDVPRHLGLRFLPCHGIFGG